MNQPLFVLENPILNYAWGSRTAIADLLGQAQRMVDPPDRLDPDGSDAIGKALKKLFADTGTQGSGAP